MSETKEMESSWLIQRLERPSDGTALLGRDNPFSFGGGLRNGGLSDEAMDLLRGIFSFDYMGAAEFEFGAVPAALREIAKNAKHYRAFSFSIAYADVPAHWRDKSGVTPSGNAVVYVICSAAHAEEVEDRIRGWASREYGNRLKAESQLASTLRPDPEYQSRVCGWLELDNGFFFFTDDAMWEKTARLFGIETKNG
jgi:hypothetical protein